LKITLNKGFVMYIKKMTAYVLMLSLAGCATSPQVVVDPKSIKDVTQYDKDLAECKAVSDGYDASGATAGSALLGAGAAVGTAALVLATGGLYLLPAGIAMAGAGGAAVGGGLSQNKEGRAREKIWAECLNERGYKAYTSN
jgi:hypothetical protein